MAVAMITAQLSLFLRRRSRRSPLAVDRDARRSPSISLSLISLSFSHLIFLSSQAQLSLSQTPSISPLAVDLDARRSPSILVLAARRRSLSLISLSFSHLRRNSLFLRRCLSPLAARRRYRHSPSISLVVDLAGALWSLIWLRCG
ncbi:hypothetical protein SO802_006225 [Lithocarpus litseifolius]|uniref:Uncharacterized protein n=1 Tax=Lithocarpus litseifolius TaxID=425828 RepID=A0AAW2DMU9_9ROSI